MKKFFGILIPSMIILIIGVLLILSYFSGGKGIGCDANNEDAVQAGKKYFQQLINQIEAYKQKNAKYPERLDNINQDFIGKGKSFPQPNITGATAYFYPDSSKFRVEFTFKPDYLCPIPLSQSRQCTYYSENRDWKCS